MLYWTVGSRRLDGGLMCTASHNPPDYTGAKLVKRGALALSGDSGIGELRELVTSGEPGEPVAPHGSVEHEDVAHAFHEAALGYIELGGAAAEGGARRRQRHGRPDGRPSARPVSDRADPHLLEAGR